jgi:biotin carboxylase
MTHSDPGPRDDGYLIVVSSLGPSSRLPFFETVSARYPIWLFIGGAGRASEPSWELPYIAGHTTVDTLDADAMLAAVAELAETAKIRGIVSYDEARIEATAKVATALGLPTSPPEAVARCRDKHLTRQALADAGVPQAESVAVKSVDEALVAANRIGYPVVLKPRNLAASFGVTRADSDADISTAYDAARNTTLPEAPEFYEDGVLVEEYLDGEEISVDSICFDGRVEPLAVAHKQTGFPPNFEEIGHMVRGGDPLHTDAALRDVVIRAHRAVGFATGVTHVELKLTSRGPRIIEINARLGGDLIPYLGRLAGGANLELAAAAVACGETPDLRRGEPKVAAIRFYYPDSDVKVAELHFEEPLLPASTERAVVLADPGQQMLLPPHGSAWESRLAQVVVVEDSEPAALAALGEAAKALVVNVASGEGS